MNNDLDNEISAKARCSFSERLKELRLGKDLTQIELAYILGVSRNHLSNIENHSNGFSIEILLKVSHYFGCSTDYLLGLTDQKKIYSHKTTDILDFINNYIITFNGIKIKEEDKSIIIDQLQNIIHLMYR